MTTNFLSAASLLTPPYLELLKQLPTGQASLWKYFAFCLQTPRPSGHLDLIKGKLTEVAAKLGFESEQDATGNIVIRKPAGPGYEKAPTICLQCHMDMVASKNEGVAHEFTTDPIQAHVDGEWLKADNTTLGADDGIGMATCLSLLEETKPLPPLELLFTVEEETDMSGAMGLAPYPFLKANTMFNVDNEDEHVVCIGCAGGFEREVRLTIEREPLASSMELLELRIVGLKGGHSGADIHRGHGNPIQWMTRILHAAQSLGPRLVALKAGMGINAIPRECSATVAVESQQANTLRELLQKEMSILQKEYHAVETNAVLTINGTNTATSQPLTLTSMQKVLDLLANLPHGVLRMSLAVPGLVESSIAFTLASLTETYLTGYLFFRSSSASHMKAYSHTLDGLARMAGATTTPDTNTFPGWNPDTSSAALKALIDTHQKMFQNPPKVEGVHAGLECGIIQERYPNMDCVSLGPQILGAHSPDE
eukprot:Ihof_evm4s7 gene=Ihof_evmTU4s7